MFCCGSKRLQSRIGTMKEVKLLSSQTRFTEKEIYQYRQQFMRMTESTGLLDREKFRDCMGILGLDSVQFLSDRIFNIMADPKGQIPFNRFLFYIDTITNGEEQEKVEMSFRLIDDQKKGYFVKEDLASMINSIVHSWAALTQTQLNQEIQRKVQQQIDHIFDVMDIKKINRVYLEDYQKVIQKYPDLLEIFDFLNKGNVENATTNNDDYNKQQQILKEIINLEKQLENLSGYLIGEKENLQILISQQNNNDIQERQATKAPSLQEIKKQIENYCSLNQNEQILQQENRKSLNNQANQENLNQQKKTITELNNPNIDIQQSIVVSKNFNGFPLEQNHNIAKEYSNRHSNKNQEENTPQIKLNQSSPIKNCQQNNFTFTDFNNNNQNNNQNNVSVFNKKFKGGSSILLGETSQFQQNIFKANSVFQVQNVQEIESARFEKNVNQLGTKPSETNYFQENSSFGMKNKDKKPSSADDFQVLKDEHDKILHQITANEDYSQTMQLDTYRQSPEKSTNILSLKPCLVKLCSFIQGDMEETIEEISERSFLYKEEDEEEKHAPDDNIIYYNNNNNNNNSHLAQNNPENYIQKNKTNYNSNNITNNNIINNRSNNFNNNTIVNNNSNLVNISSNPLENSQSINKIFNFNREYTTQRSKKELQFTPKGALTSNNTKEINVEQQNNKSNTIQQVNAQNTVINSPSQQQKLSTANKMFASEIQNNFNINDPMSCKQSQFYASNNAELENKIQIMNLNQMKQKISNAYNYLIQVQSNIKGIIKNLDQNFSLNKKLNYQQRYSMLLDGNIKLKNDNSPGLMHQSNPINGNIQKKNTNQLLKEESNQIKTTKSKKSLLKKSMVFFGHQDWNLVVNMMIGIRMSVKSASSNVTDAVIQNRDFKVKYLFELLPKKIGEDKQQIYKVCKFQDYAPNVFQKIRSLYNISDEEYLKSIGPDQLFSSMVKGDFNSFTQLTSTGKSGSFFYYTADGKFTLKTINRSEFNHLKQILKNYYEHLANNRNSLIIKFFGLHKIKIRMKKSMNEQIVCFVIMANVFHTRKYINEKFDLKGSKYGRITKQNQQQTKGITFKDLDFINQNRKLNIKENQYNEFMNIIRKDAQFFEENNIIDYSLLVGIHHKHTRLDESDQNSQVLKSELNEFRNAAVKAQQDQKNTNLSQLISRDENFIYLFGIIDILTCFNAKKKFEYIAKRIAFGPEISAIPPAQYSQRFVNFIDSIFDDQSKVEQKFIQ